MAQIITEKHAQVQGLMSKLTGGLNNGSISLREVQKLNADGSKAGDPSFGLVDSNGNVVAILVTKPTRTVTSAPRTERQWNYFLGRFDEKTIPGTESTKPRYQVLAPVKTA
jgi:hypothetical protein